MKKIYISLFYLIPILIQAQDTIYRKDSSIQIGKIIEINKSQLKYKIIENIQGQLYVLSLDDVLKVIYQDGKTVIFNFSTTPDIMVNPVKLKKSEKIYDWHNEISINIADLVFCNFFTISYEYHNKAGNFGFKIPISIGFSFAPDYDSNILNNGYLNYNDHYYNNYKLFNIGVDLYFYPKSKSKFKYFIGGEFTYGQFERNYETYNPNSKIRNYKIFKGQYLTFLFQNGYKYHLNKNFFLSANLGIGIEVYHRINDAFLTSYSNSIILVLRSSFCIGYKF